jgi:hypothetical protein
VRKPGLSPIVRLRNTSAIPMRITVQRAPDWFILTPPIQLDAQATTLLRPGVTGDAPVGEHRIELQLEITNLHTGPDRNLSVTVPLTVQIGR